jgi:branched-subunit amino acid transport protein
VTVWIVFVLAGLGTYGLRLSGIALLRDPDRISPTLQRGLRMIGPAAMGAIIANSLVLSDGEWRPFGAWHVAAFVAVAAGFWKRSMGWAMAAGVATFAALLATGVA